MKSAGFVSAFAFGVLSLAGNANATLLTYLGQDYNNSSTVPLTATPNSSAAQTSFLSGLTTVGIENFEGFATGTTQPVSTMNGLTSTLTGGSGYVNSVAPGHTNNYGRYSVAGPSKYYELHAGGANGTFEVSFDREIAAFGFYGIDIGDVAGTLILDVRDELSQLIASINVPAASWNGGVLFEGIVASNPAELFKSVTFRTTAGGGDDFGFDGLIVADQSQVLAIPEPNSLALFGVGLVALFATKSRKLKTLRREVS